VGEAGRKRETKRRYKNIDQEKIEKHRTCRRNTEQLSIYCQWWEGRKRDALKDATAVKPGFYGVMPGTEEKEDGVSLSDIEKKKHTKSHRMWHRDPPSKEPKMGETPRKKRGTQRGGAWKTKGKIRKT